MLVLEAAGRAGQYPYLAVMPMAWALVEKSRCWAEMRLRAQVVIWNCQVAAAPVALPAMCGWYRRPRTMVSQVVRSSCQAVTQMPQRKPVEGLSYRAGWPSLGLRAA